MPGNYFRSQLLANDIRNAIGIRAKDGIVLATEKLITSRMLKPGTNRRIESVDNHIGFVRSFIAVYV